MIARKFSYEQKAWGSMICCNMHLTGSSFVYHKSRHLCTEVSGENLLVEYSWDITSLMLSCQGTKFNHSKKQRGYMQMYKFSKVLSTLIKLNCK